MGLVRATAGVRGVPEARAVAVRRDGAHVHVATPGDSRMIATLIDLAGRGHLPRSPYSMWFPGPAAHRIAEIERLVRASIRTPFHWSLFWVAEIHGRAVAALACYHSARVGFATLDRALSEIGWDGDRVTALHRRVDPLRNAAIVPRPTTWTIDHVAVLPDYWGYGLARRLLNYAMTEGSEAGFGDVCADVGVGNHSAMRLFERAGFRAAFRYPDAGTGLRDDSRGVIRLCRSLR